ncbi:MAG TPA: hypothetical protein VHV78_17265, partial [Gemmatimonadaceae bacterium]|nr:hypothetical protein [Gemmatimonadaceae bacterium]
MTRPVPIIRGVVRCLAVAVAAGTAACMAGPKYVPEEAVRPSQRIGVQRMSDSSRVFFDSLAIERRRDSVRLAPPPAARQLSGNDSLTALAWLDLIRDTSLVRLVNTALQQNRGVQVAVARINEYRAAVTAARAPLAPSVT